MEINKLLEKKKKETKGQIDKTLPKERVENILTTVKELALKRIKEDENQPRKTYDEEKIESLAESIKEKGLLQPIIVKIQGNSYLIIAGHRRYRAYKYLEKDTIPCIVKESMVTKDDLFELALLENLQREDLNTLEIAESLDQLKKLKNISQKEISIITGYSKGTVSKYIQLYAKIKDDPEKKEKIKQLGFEKGYNKFCVIKKKDPEKTSKGKKLSIQIINENNEEEIKQAINKVKDYLKYLKTLLEK